MYLMVTHLDITYIISVLIHSCSNLARCTRSVHHGFSCTSRMPSKKVLSISTMILEKLDSSILMFDILGTKEIINQLQSNMQMLEVT